MKNLWLNQQLVDSSSFATFVSTSSEAISQESSNSNLTNSRSSGSNSNTAQSNPSGCRLNQNLPSSLHQITSNKLSAMFLPIFNPAWTVPTFSLLVLLVIILPLPVTDAQAPDISSMFSLDRLGEYNQLIHCVTKISAEFTRCNVDAQRKGETVLQYVDEKSELARLLKCCGIWQVRDCWIAAASQHCNSGQVEQIRQMPSKFMPGLDDLCSSYPSGSSSCYTPHLVIAAVLLCSMVLVICLILLTVFVCRRCNRRRRARNQRKHLDPSALSVTIHHNDEDKLHCDDTDKLSEKVKLTSDSRRSSNQGNSSKGNGGNGKNNNFIDSEKGK